MADISNHGAEFIIRKLVLVAFLFGVMGTGSELLLLDHTEDVWMWLPLVLQGSGILLIAVFLIGKQRSVLRVFQFLMIAFIFSGFVGIWLHYKGNAEFELEMYPSMRGFELFLESLKGATPALAPGTMVLLGLLGLTFAFRHPSRVQESRPPSNK